MSAVLPAPCVTGYVTIEQFNKMIDFFKSEIAELKDKLEETNLLLEASLKKNTRLENAVFECYEDGEIKFDECEKPILNKNLSCATEKPTIEPKAEETPTIDTTLDKKAAATVGYLQTEVKPNEFGEFVIGRKELELFLTTIVDTELRVKKVSRQLKSDIFQRAVELFSGIVHIKTSKSGNKTKMLALKMTTKRTITSTFAKTSPLGILA